MELHKNYKFIYQKTLLKRTKCNPRREKRYQQQMFMCKRTKYTFINARKEPVSRIYEEFLQMRKEQTHLFKMDETLELTLHKDSHMANKYM